MSAFFAVSRGGNAIFLRFQNSMVDLGMIDNYGKIFCGIPNLQELQIQESQHQVLSWILKTGP